MSRAVQLMLVAAGACAAALAVNYFIADRHLGSGQLVVMVASLIAFWAWKSRNRQ